jgi:hypothetical protein
LYSWLLSSIERLSELRNSDAGWGYYPGGDSSVEPTALSALALLSGHRYLQGLTHLESVNSAAKWLVELQSREGWLGVTPNMPEASWPTPYAILLWSNLKGFEAESERAVAWLLEQRGKSLEKTGIYGHDVSLQGWPWISGTHSWVEPTAASVIALRRCKHLNHPRTRQGIKLILDRAIDGGGWNYGNTSVFGQELHPQPAPTGLALLALADLHDGQDAVKTSCAYLRKILPETRSSASLSWGVLGLSAWEERPAEAGRWLEESYRQVQAGGNSALSLACLILAGVKESCDLFRQV